MIRSSERTKKNIERDRRDLQETAWSTSFGKRIIRIQDLPTGKDSDSIPGIFGYSPWRSDEIPRGLGYDPVDPLGDRQVNIRNHRRFRDHGNPPIPWIGGRP